MSPLGNPSLIVIAWQRPMLDLQVWLRRMKGRKTCACWFLIAISATHRHVRDKGRLLVHHTEGSMKFPGELVCRNVDQ